jgi:hypothetical protein
MDGFPADQTLAQIVSNAQPTTIADVIRIMQDIDRVLPDHDGLKWFNLLYLFVTQAVEGRAPAAGWQDPVWLGRLDVVFAQLYFAAIANATQDPALVPRAWQALLEARFRPGVDRVQFALCGMNAHINHDLPLAVVQTGEELNLPPTPQSAQHDDFKTVNTLLDVVEPEAMQFLATGPLGQIAQDLGRIGQILAMWNVRKARETAWTNAEILWQIRGLPLLPAQFLLTLDRLTGLAGRGMVVAI